MLFLVLMHHLKESDDNTHCFMFSDRKCGQGEFQCNNTLCISDTFTCDGQDDCLDRSDEDHSMCCRCFTQPLKS